MNIDPRKYLSETARSYDFTTSNVDTKIILTDNYESKFGIFQHQLAANRRPLSSVAFHTSEDMLTHSLLAESMRTFESKKIGDIFRISYLEYMNLPVSVVSLMKDICDEILASRTKEANNVDNMLKNAMNGVSPKLK